MSPTRVRRHAFVRGRVQGVWFRESTRRAAAALRVDGWVRNLSDGGVEVVLEGSEEQVDAALAWLANGPPHARVDEVDVATEEPEGISGFTVR